MMTMACHSEIVWFYHVIDGRDVRAPIDLATDEIDWNKIEYLEEKRQPAIIPMRRRYQSRQKEIRIIAADVRLNSHSQYTRRALIHEVMLDCRVSYDNARLMIYRARRLTA